MMALLDRQRGSEHYASLNLQPGRQEAEAARKRAVRPIYLELDERQSGSEHSSLNLQPGLG